MRKIVAQVLGILCILSTFFNGLTIAGQEGFKYEVNGTVYTYNSPFVTILIDGKVVETGDMPAITHEGRTLVPVREVFESDGVKSTVSWDDDLKKATILLGDKVIVLQMGSNIAFINGEKVALDVPAQLIKDVTKQNVKAMIPLRFVSEELGYKVEWVASEYKAILKSEKYIKTEEQPDTETDDSTTATTSSSIEVDDKGEGSESKSLPTALALKPIIWTGDTTSVTPPNQTGVVITKEDHDTTSITKVEYANNTFIVQGTAQITNVSQSTWNGKLILDIENAEYSSSKYEYSFENNPYVTSVRTSQYSNEPKVVRVVFDLKVSGVEFSTTLSEDRRQILVTGVDNRITKFNIGQNTEGDFVEIYGNFTPEIKVMRLTQPDRLVFDLPNTISAVGTKSVKDIGGQFATAVRTAQFDEKTTRVVLETAGHADYRIDNLNGLVRVTLMPPSYKNIEYTNDDQTEIKLDQDINNQIDINAIKYTDNYLKKEYIIEFPSDYSKFFGTGVLKVNDGKINSIDVINTNGKTKLVIHEAGIYEFRVKEADGKVSIVAYEPREIYDQIVVIDPGHGGSDPGAIGDGLYEKEANLSIALYLKTYLDQNKSIKVYYTRLDDTYPTLTERAELSNSVKADRFISIHNNAYRSDFNGTETYYFNGPSTTGLDSKELADILHQSILANISQNDRNVRDGSKLFVLRNTTAPATLLEIAYMTNASDLAKLKNEDFKKNAAKGIYQGIVKSFELYPTQR